MKTKFIDIGFCFARMKLKYELQPDSVCIQIVSPEYSEENTFEPVSFVELYGTEEIRHFAETIIKNIDELIAQE